MITNKNIQQHHHHLLSKKIIIIFMLSILFIIGLSSEILSQNYDKDFTTAQKLYDKAIGYKSIGKNQEEMLQLFEEVSSIYLNLIEKENINNAYLYYNLANCYYNMGQIGESIYYYKIAKQLKPEFRDINKNLLEARSNVDTYIENKEKDSIIKVLFFWHYQTSIQTKLIIAIVLFTLVWIILGVNLLFFRQRIFIGLGLASLVVSIVFFVSIFTQFINDKNQWWGVVTSNQGVNAKIGPGENYASRFDQKLSEGVEFEVIEEKDEWMKIKLDNNEVCWIAKSSTHILQNSVLFK